MTSAVVPVLIVLAFLFSGYLIDPALIPVWLRWLQYVSFLKYGTSVLMISQFSGDPTAEKLLEQYVNVSVGLCYGALVASIVVLRAISYIFLRINRPKFDHTL